MILKALFLVVLLVPKLIISLFPVIDFEIPQDVMVNLSSIMMFVGYFVPVKGLVALFTLSLSIDIGHIVWTIILRVKSFIPTMGN